MSALGGIRRLADPETLRRAARDPRFRWRKVNRAYHRRFGARTHDPAGLDVMAADWDVLVVLDACRYDTFAAVHDLPGTLRRVRSRGSHTSEFVWGNFAERSLHDAVYVTANVVPGLYDEALDFHHVERVFEDGFDGETGTVPPDAVAARARRAAERFPNKRLIVHYLQPHFPFRDAPVEGYGTMDFWDAVATGELSVSTERVYDWYRENLKWALSSVRDLLPALDGRVVVTADHGNAFGERSFPVPMREWGHPWGTYIDPLVEVPWLVRESDSRPRITEDPPTDQSGFDEEILRSRLEALGYA